jgi:hypothetical protein
MESVSQAMSGSTWLVAGVMILEIGAGIAYGIQQKWVLCLVWTGYGVASVGLLLIGEKNP